MRSSLKVVTTLSLLAHATAFVAVFWPRLRRKTGRGTVQRPA